MSCINCLCDILWFDAYDMKHMMSIVWSGDSSGSRTDAIIEQSRPQV